MPNEQNNTMLKWSAQLPDTAGYWFMRRPESPGKWIIFNVQVVDDEIFGFPCGGDDPRPISSWAAGCVGDEIPQWAGPITLPSELRS